jgi:hypothetical protein
VGQSAIDPEEFLQQLKEEHRNLRWEPLPPHSIRSPGSDQGRNRRSLDYLHAHWALPDSPDAGAMGGGLRGRALSLFGRLTFRVLGRYLRDERELLAHMVRVNQALELRCDDLTLRCQQLNQDMIDRQVAEAANQAKLALWLHLDPAFAGRTDENGNGRAGAPGEAPTA